MKSAKMCGHLSAILLLLQLLGCISMGVAIQCYVCDSSDNPGCTNLWPNSSISSVNCTLDKMKSVDTWLFELNKFSYFDNGANKNPLMNCQKVVARDPKTNELVTARFCQLDTADSNACNILRTKLGLKNDAASAQGGHRQRRWDQQRTKGYGQQEEEEASPQDEFFCDICSEDHCNGADAVTLTTSLTLGLIFVLQLLRCC